MRIPTCTLDVLFPDRLRVGSIGRDAEVRVHNYGSVAAADDHVLLRSEINGRKSGRVPPSVMNIP